MAVRVSICDWLPPDFGAVGQHALMRARERARAGEGVVLVGLSSSGARVDEERYGPGWLRVVRLRRPRYDRARVVQRGVWTLVTNLRLVAAAWPYARRADEVLFTGSPPFLIFLLVPLNRACWRRRLVYRISDFYPEVLIADRAPRTPPPLRWLLRATVALRHRVDRLEVLGEDQRRRLLAQGLPAERVQLVPEKSPVVIDAGTRPLPVPEPLRGKRVLLYSGNFGVAHDHETFLAAYRRHHSEGSARVGLWLNATGAKADLLERLLRAEGLPLHRSAPGPLEELPRLMVTPAAHLITLRDAFVGYVLPSKVHACLESARAILFIGSASSDVDRLCRSGRPRRYWRVDVGDAGGALAALEELAEIG